MLALFGSDKEEESWRDRDPGDGISESDWYLVESLPFPRVEVADHRAMAERTRYRRRESGYPIIVGSDEHLIRLAEQWVRQERDPTEILAAADRLPMPERLSDLRRRRGAKRGPPVGDWPEDEIMEDDSEPSLFRDPLTGALIEKAYLLLIPCRHGYEVPAYLNFGAWNSCPPPEYHVAAMREWNRRYGSELIALGGDVAVLQATSRPVLSGECLALAREHFDYCPDVLDLGYDNLSTLAAFLKESDWWHFWWD